MEKKHWIRVENRQRAVFMAGCDVLDETLMTYAYNPA